MLLKDGTQIQKTPNRIPEKSEFTNKFYAREKVGFHQLTVDFRIYWSSPDSNPQNLEEVCFPDKLLPSQVKPSKMCGKQQQQQSEICSEEVR